MATGSNIQPRRDVGVTNITPGIDFRNGDAEAWEAAGRVADRLWDAAKPNLLMRAKARGAEIGDEIAAGEREYKAPRLVLGEVAAAREQAIVTAYDARIRSDIDNRERELRQQFRLDPQGYEAAWGAAQSGFIQAAPPEFAVAVETYARTRGQDGLGAVSAARVDADQREASQALGVRIATLDERLIALASRPGGLESPEYAEALSERQGLQDQRMSNPAILYSEAQRAVDDDKLADGVTSANVTRLAIEQYTAGGKGLAGVAAATRFLNEEVLQGEAFSDLSPDRLQRIYRDAVSQVRDFSAVDREETRLEEAREREERAARRELVGDYRLRILMGEATEDQIQADASLTDADKAGLIASARAQARRAATEARTEVTLGRVAAYNELSTQAFAGGLTNGEIADALNAGTITGTQASTLRSLNNRTIKPIVDDVLAPVRDATRGPGRSGRPNAEKMAEAERHAANWASANPDSTIQERVEFGRFIAQTVFGGGASGAGRPQGAQAAAQGRQAELRALEAERATRQRQGRAMPQAEYNRRRNEIINGG
ncbi:hypothetical protein [Brevundimonas sp.]|uniref:hypothetical protein n=1 Tax=Brevundimonas sp. TaxID=1871086 RepID=UPI0035B480EF